MNNDFAWRGIADELFKLLFCLLVNKSSRNNVKIYCVNCLQSFAVIVLDFVFHLYLV